MDSWAPGKDPGRGTRIAAWSEDSLSSLAIHSPALRRGFQSRLDREPAGTVRAVWGRDGASGDRPAPIVGTLNFWKSHPASEVLAQPNPSCQRPLFCPFAALDQQPEVSRTEPLTNRGVDLGVAVILQSSDQTVLLTRRTCTLRISPNLWVPPGEHLGTGSMGDRCPLPPQCYWEVPYSSDPTSMSTTNFLCPLENGVPG